MLRISGSAAAFHEVAKVLTDRWPGLRRQSSDQNDTSSEYCRGRCHVNSDNLSMAAAGHQLRLVPACPRRVGSENTSISEQRTRRSIARFSASVPSHHGRSSTAFTTIAEPHFKHAQPQSERFNKRRWSLTLSECWLALTGRTRSRARQLSSSMPGASGADVDRGHEIASERNVFGRQRRRRLTVEIRIDAL
jgi:hypothetical protein